jgi:hypothetical protein
MVRGAGFFRHISGGFHEYSEISRTSQKHKKIIFQFRFEMNFFCFIDFQETFKFNETITFYWNEFPH